jgi:hypothetical protein
VVKIIDFYPKGAGFDSRVILKRMTLANVRCCVSFACLKDIYFFFSENLGFCALILLMQYIL